MACIAVEVIEARDFSAKVLQKYGANYPPARLQSKVAVSPVGTAVPLSLMAPRLHAVHPHETVHCSPHQPYTCVLIMTHSARHSPHKRNCRAVTQTSRWSAEASRP
eukprot:505941-Pleurochrysis_carterae.AAC.2